jgi:hypothetical protein
MLCQYALPTNIYKILIFMCFKANVNIAYLPKENEEDYEKLKKDMPEIFDDNHYCILAELLTNDVSM